MVATSVSRVLLLARITLSVRSSIAKSETRLVSLMCHFAWKVDK